MHPAASFWDRGVRNVPDMTGAKNVLQCEDMGIIIPALGLSLPLGHTLDYGCGTGRLSAICSSYVGLDITPSCVDYCRERGLDAHLIHGPEDIPDQQYDVITCISICTHIGHEERGELLTAFRSYAPTLIIDIIPGDGSGETRLWTAVPSEFEALIASCGWKVTTSFELPWRAPFEVTQHRYYRCDQ
jgi:SAM-dependent methyltransferase